MMFKYLVVLALVSVTIAAPITSDDEEKKSPINTEFEQDALMAHNLYRRIHGVAPLKLNHVLSKMALKRARELADNGKLNVKQIMFNESTLGETVGVVDGFSSYNGISATQLWYSVVNKFDEEGESSNEGASFTQMVWKATTQVGFAIAKSNDGKFYFVAEYYPSGNIRGQYDDQVFQLTDIKMTKEKTDSKCVSPKTVELWKSLLKRFDIESDVEEAKVDNQVEEMETELDEIIEKRPEAVEEVDALESDLEDLIFAAKTTTTMAPTFTTTTQPMVTMPTTTKKTTTTTTTMAPKFMAKEKETEMLMKIEEEAEKVEESELDLLTKEIRRLLAEKDAAEKVKVTTTTTTKAPTTTTTTTTKKTTTTTTTMKPTTTTTTTTKKPTTTTTTTMKPTTTTTTTMKPTTTTTITTTTEKPKSSLARLLLDIDPNSNLDDLLAALKVHKMKQAKSELKKKVQEKKVTTTMRMTTVKPFLITRPPTTTTPVSLIVDDGFNSAEDDEEEDYDYEQFFATTTMKPTTTTTTTLAPITSTTTEPMQVKMDMKVREKKEKKIDHDLLKRLLAMLQ